MDMVSMVDIGDVRRGKLKPNLLPNLPLKLLPNLVTTMAMDMDLGTDSMEDTEDTMDMVSMVDMVFGDVRRGRLQPNLPRIPTSTMDMDMDSAMVDTMDMALGTTDMVLDTMDTATIGENKSQIHQAHYQHSASKCLDGNNDDLSFCCRTHSF